MMIKKLKPPVENVEYTFRFPPKKLFTYRWYGETDKKGRLIFWNVGGKYYTSFTPQYFTYLQRNRLVGKKDVIAEEKPEDNIKEKSTPVSQLTKESGSPVVKEIKEVERDRDKVEPLTKELIKYLEDLIGRLKTITDQGKLIIRAKFPMQKEYLPERLIADMQQAIKNGISDKGFGVLMSRYLKIDNELRNARKK